MYVGNQYGTYYIENQGSRLKLKSVGAAMPFTGCAIKNGTHSFDYKCSYDRNPSNFKTKFIFYWTEPSFEVYNSLLGQLA